MNEWMNEWMWFNHISTLEKPFHAKKIFLNILKMTKQNIMIA